MLLVKSAHCFTMISKNVWELKSLPVVCDRKAGCFDGISTFVDLETPDPILFFAMSDYYRIVYSYEIMYNSGRNIHYINVSHMSEYAHWHRYFPGVQ